jgi:hypothetical protein
LNLRRKKKREKRKRKKREKREKREKERNCFEFEEEEKERDFLCCQILLPVWVALQRWWRGAKICPNSFVRIGKLRTAYSLTGKN